MQAAFHAHVPSVEGGRLRVKNTRGSIRFDRTGALVHRQTAGKGRSPFSLLSITRGD
jgi:hypothetical protein